MKKSFQYYQPNELDLKDKYYDDPIRALTKIFDKSWVEIYDELAPICRKFQCSFNEKICYEMYLSQNGFVYTGISNKKGTKRPTVKSFANSHKVGKYFVNIAKHNVAVVEGIYYNTWDCDLCSMYGYWCLPEDKY